MSAVHQLHSMHLADMARELRDKAWAAGYAQGYMEGEAAAERRKAAEITPDDRWDVLAMIVSYALVALIAVLILWPEPVWRVLGVSP